MKESFTKFLEKPILKNPILIVGLPGVGNIGKLAATHLINELKAKKFAILYSPHFPYHVTISDKGIIRLLNNEFFYFISKKEISDLIILRGDYQSQTIYGQYEVAGLIIDLCKEFNVKEIITIGGYATGDFKEPPRIFGAINRPSLKSWIEQLAVEYCDIGSPIVGAAGLLIGLAKLYDIDGICLLGETPGFITDAKIVKEILHKILTFLKLDVDLSKLDEKDQEIKETIDKILEIEKKKEFVKKLKEKFTPSKKDLSYFG